MNAIDKQYINRPKMRWTQIVSTLAVILLFFWSTSAIQLKNWSANGLEIAGNILNGLVTPDLDILFNFTQKGVPYLLLETMSIALLGTIVGGILAIPLAFLSASNIVPKPISFIVRFILIIIRTIPAIVYGLMFIRVTGPGPFTGVLTMSLTSIGMLSKLYVDVIEDLDTSVLESMESIGCTTIEKIRFGIIPQLTAMFLSIFIYRYDMNLRDAAILGLVGAGGIGAPLIFAMNSYRWSEAGSILIGLILLILIIEIISNKIRTKLVQG
ncbi:MAG: phosphonate ABC transporter, permease protein PhnE [Candidatus Pristimantibacillus lignocellulolyticus]|uniref:Phosphonate ABC transporter, permease protein PhnE n=1 Tax=Candidatus Pristimantibacillus lignocellulolyticus TaxID=2994561 RepID=A0A9J6ZDY1_9BACL|nr:MAG: phosphonate ABC transporter, permease protein PhnE [Candidatus Pristimantibacillus lignocellulolyticus]